MIEHPRALSNLAGTLENPAAVRLVGASVRLCRVRPAGILSLQQGLRRAGMHNVGGEHTFVELFADVLVYVHRAAPVEPLELHSNGLQHSRNRLYEPGRCLLGTVCSTVRRCVPADAPPARQR